MDSAKKILTIDGAGLCRVLAAAIIEQMEEAAGRRAHGIFDCFYDTSTGAILTAALARDMSASELKQFYLDKGAEVFENLPFVKIIKRLLEWTYSKENLEEDWTASSEILERESSFCDGDATGGTDRRPVRAALDIP